jgi:hypothetical protein
MAEARIDCLIGKARKDGSTSWYWQPSATLKAAGWNMLALGKDKEAAIDAAIARNAEVAACKAGRRPSKDSRRTEGAPRPKGRPARWPEMMKLADAAEYCGLSVRAFEQEVMFGRLPLWHDFAGKELWRKSDIDKTLDRITGKLPVYFVGTPTND